MLNIGIFKRKTQVNSLDIKHLYRSLKVSLLGIGSINMNTLFSLAYLDAILQREFFFELLAYGIILHSAVVDVRCDFLLKKKKTSFLYHLYAFI